MTKRAPGPAMAAILDEIAKGGIVVLDGGTGTEIERRGAPMSEESWCAPATLSHGDIVREVHRDYILAGARIVTANTYGSSPFILDHHGKLADLPLIDGTAVRLAREAIDIAGRPGVAVAGSFSVMRPAVVGTDRTADRNWSEQDARDILMRKAEALAEAGVDLIMMEMMRDTDYSLWATEAAVATGLPVWVGLSAERDADGRLRSYARHEFSVAEVAAALMSTGAALLSVMHSPTDLTGPALAEVRTVWPGPLGAYPEHGHFEMPHWRFVEVSPEAFAQQCLGWIDDYGVQMVGGCCGTGPEHIRALADALAARQR
ncbi:MAG: homocysteine S-methyltransferase family protein [Hyphomicrobiaceae bacterium]